MEYLETLLEVFKIVHNDGHVEEAVDLLKDLTADQRTETLVTLEMFGDVVDRARRESGDI